MSKYSLGQKDEPKYIILQGLEMFLIEGFTEKRREQRFVVAFGRETVKLNFSDSNVYPNTSEKFGVPAVTFCPYVRSDYCNYFHMSCRSHENESLSKSPLDNGRLMIFQSGDVKSFDEKYNPENIRKQYGRIRSISFRKDNETSNILVTIINDDFIEYVQVILHPTLIMPFRESQFQFPRNIHTDINQYNEERERRINLCRIASEFNVIRFSIRVFNGQSVSVEMQ